MAPIKKTSKGAVRIYCCHAEIDALKAARPGDVLEIIRWTKSGENKISKPCPGCLKYIREKGIRRIYYQDRNGSIVRENIGRA
jgi:deoxycytidylate deaminase